RRQRLAAAGGRMHQSRFARPIRVPHLALEREGAPAVGGEPRLEGGACTPFDIAFQGMNSSTFAVDSGGPDNRHPENDKPTPGAPAPLAPRASAASGATFSTNVSNAPGSYEGETGAASNGTTIVGGANSIVAGACGSNPCYVRAYASSDGGATWVSSQISG